MSDISPLTAALADHYRIERELGSGGMATVYLARDLKHDREVAIKVLHAELAAAIGSERFLAEIKTTARLQHPHILPLLDSGEASGRLYYVMPYVTGETLRARLEREGQLSIDSARRIALEVADALGSAHALGIIHRDIKPENILLQGGHAVVADFGIALAVQTAGGARMTQTGLSLGTPQYMSPEQAMGEKTVDARSDIYALGAVTYEMLAGEPPFSGQSVQAIVAKVLTERPTPLSTLRDTVPEALENAVHTALAKLPADRFASAAEFSAALAGDAIGTARTRTAMANAPQAKAWARRFLVASVLAVVATVAALWGWLRPTSTPHTVRYSLLLDSTESIGGAYQRLALSPDGTKYVTGNRSRPLLLHDRSELSGVPIPGTEGGAAPAFSPDGAQIAFTLGPQLKVTSLSGGAFIVAEGMTNDWTAWSDDGWIYAARNLLIVRVRPVAGAAVNTVSRHDSAANEVAHFFPSALPGGRYILFTARTRTSDNVVILDTKSGTHRALFAGSRGSYASSGHILYYASDGNLMSVPFDLGAQRTTGTPTVVAPKVAQSGPFANGGESINVSRDGATIMYTALSSGAARELAWVTRQGQSEPAFKDWHTQFDGPALSPDGRRVVVSDGVGGIGKLWVREFAKSEPLELLTESATNRYPTWLPNGREVSFYSDRGGKGGLFHLWRVAADGSAPPELAGSNTQNLTESLWSPDGQWLVTRTYLISAGGGNIVAFQKGVDTVPRPIVATPSNEYSPTLSPDARWMAYTSNAESGFQIYVVPFPVASTKYRVSTNGGVEPRWSRDGKEIFYRDGQGNMVSAAVHTSPTFAVERVQVLFKDGEFFRDVNYAHPQSDVSADGKCF